MRYDGVPWTYGRKFARNVQGKLGRGGVGTIGSGHRMHDGGKGFTLAEGLIALAVVVVLFALAVPNLVAIQRELRQKELDTKAETIYVAAQDQLVKLRASGRANLYEVAPDAQLVVSRYEERFVPSDFVPVYDEEGKLIQNIHFMIRGSDQANNVMTPKAVAGELLKSHWVIEYDPTNCNVYAVFYSEAQDIDADYESNWNHYDDLRERSKRFADGAWVGYYGGDASSMRSSTSSLSPQVDIENKERLVAHLRCKAPLGVDDIEFTLKLTDGEGNAYTRTYASAELNRLGLLWSLDVVLDDLSAPDTRFCELFDGSYTNVLEAMRTESSALVPGTKLTVELTAKSHGNELIEPGRDTKTCNSLFADASTAEVAHIACARHLQNLDASSGVTDEVRRAVQDADVTFRDTGDEDTWYDLYHDEFFNGRARGTASFKPIENDSIESYEGGNHRIVGLNVAAAEGALFARVDGGVTLKGIRLVGARVGAARGGASSGIAEVSAALVAEVVGDENVIEACAVLLERPDYQGTTEADVWIRAKTAGGLVGVVKSGSLKIEGSHASTVIEGTLYGAGLVGRVESGDLEIGESYADCYLMGVNLSGLANGDARRVSTSYAAGYHSATGLAAGLVSGDVDKLERSYTILARLADTSEYYAMARSASTVDQAYYFTPSYGIEGGELEGTDAIGSMDAAELATRLGSSFTLDNAAQTFPYNLMRQSLTTYTWPRLKNLRHYGDWKAEFEVGALVYYERYADGSSGFWGANVSSTLADDKVVVGDGYGVVYLARDTAPDVVEVRSGGLSQRISTRDDAYVAVTGADEDQAEYHIYPLSKEMMCADGAEGFFQGIEISSDASPQVAIYYFNPHFAKTARLGSRLGDASGVELGWDDEIAIRSARHLYDLSRLYDEWLREPTQGRSFVQELDLSYAAYDWENYTTYGATVRSQRPIGGGEETSFDATYDGLCHTVSDVSFVSEEGSYLGLIGYNVGNVRNVVLSCAFDPASVEDSSNVRRVRGMGTNEVVYIGVLCGYNDGLIDNCAVAGYYVAGSDATLHAYANSTLHVGGLVGGNGGYVRSSSADCPAIRVSSLYAEVWVGGFVGSNAGSIVDCYDLGYLEVAESRGGSLSAAGFAGACEGRILRSYCACAIVTSGETATSYAFSPLAAGVIDCRYLDQGAYRYVGGLHTYKSVTARTAGMSASYLDLSTLDEGRRVDASHSHSHPNTDESAYPFHGVVRDASNDYVHYGDWVIEPSLGTLGVFYWEHEEGGSNSGYHLTYLGSEKGMDVSGTTLCVAHDDGGVIDAFGYGYYVSEDDNGSVSVASQGLASSMGGDGSAGTFNAVAAASFEEQMAGYCFYPYTTRLSSDGDYLYLDNAEERTGTWTLSFFGDEGQIDYTYEICPFFANAMCRKDVEGSTYVLTSADGRVSDYAQEAGSADNAYEVRSHEQLAYINWNCESYGTSTLVNLQNSHQFPFLQYATVTGKGIQPKADALAARPRQTWVQTHDVDASGVEGYTPIAGMGTSTVDYDQDNYLYAWFGGTYDGQSYKIQNLDIVSDSYTVGLFGVTVGADIQSVILYGDGSTRVERNTSSGGQVADTIGAYNIGGLIGFAYDYSATDTANVIANCAIAGYRVVDASTNKQGMGKANVGGLFGATSLAVERCTAMADIEIASLQSEHPQYGSYIRVGGLAGSALHEVRDCYSGGSITVARQTLDQLPLGYIEGKKTTGLARDKATNIFVAGFVCGSYTFNISNFTAKSGQTDGAVTMENCYTYTRLPKLEGTIRAVSLFASQGDRYEMRTKMYANNCHYLDAVRTGLTYDHDPAYFFSVNKQNRVITDAEFEAMLDGDLRVLRTILNDNNAGGGRRPDPAMAVTFDELSSQSMVDTLNGGASGVWAPVTVTEPSGAVIDGKYSFSSDAAQQGKNYPFPTVVTQRDNTYSTGTSSTYVHVHYGAWPHGAAFWANGRDTMDLFESLDVTDTTQRGGPYAEETFVLLCDTSQLGSPNITFSPAGMAELDRCVRRGDGSGYDVVVRALSSGFVTVTEENTGASFVLDITAKLTLGADPTPLMLYRDTAGNVTLTATAALPEVLDDGQARTDLSNSEYSSFELAAADDADADLFSFEQHRGVGNENRWKVTSFEPGRRMVRAHFTYDYHGERFSAVRYFETVTVGEVGLSNGVDARVANRRAVGTMTGFDTVSPEVAGVEDAQFFLFATAADGDLANLDVEGVGVVDAAGEPADDLLGAYLAPEPEPADAGAAYRVWKGYVTYLGETVPDDIFVRVNLVDSNGVARYVLTVPVRAESILGHTVSFDAGGGEGSMPVVGVGGDDYRLPACAFTREGYRFDGWSVDGVIYGEGEVVTIGGHATAVAQWSPITYHVRFDANGGVGEMPDQELVYDINQPLAANQFEPQMGYQRFDGWNTQADGTGVSFGDGEEIVSLSPTDGAVVTLFAQWKTLPRLTLESAGEVVWEGHPEGGALDMTYGMPVLAGWELDGWFDGTRADSSQVLDAAGNIVIDELGGCVAGGAFDVTADTVLYARWSRIAYLAIDSLASPADDGTYLIAGAAGSGTRLFLAANENSAKLGSVEGLVQSGTVFDEQGLEHTTYVADVADQALWFFSYARSHGGYDYFAVQSNVLRGNKPQYLRGNGTDLLTTDTLMYNGSYSNKQMWMYGQAHDHGMQCENQIFESSTGYYLYLDGGTWRHNARDKSVYLYRQQRIYSYFE